MLNSTRGCDGSPVALHSRMSTAVAREGYRSKDTGSLWGRDTARRAPYRQPVGWRRGPNVVPAPSLSGDRRRRSHGSAPPPRSSGLQDPGSDYV
eukprot:7391638-Prymnesium_polylepis.7